MASATASSLPLPTLKNTFGRFGGAPAIFAPEEVHGKTLDPMTYEGIVRQGRYVGEVFEGLNLLGQSVASVLPNGPGAAAAVPTIAFNAAMANFNPALVEESFRASFKKLGVRAVIVDDKEPSETALAAAARLNIPTMRLQYTGESAASYTLDISNISPIDASNMRLDDPDRIAMTLFTSGTTANAVGDETPVGKIIPHTLARKYYAAAQFAKFYGITETDMTIILNPLSHVHAVANTESALQAGSMILCPPGVTLHNKDRFFTWMQEADALGHAVTWWSAVPTIHKYILEESLKGDNSEALQRLREHVRWMGSSSDKMDVAAAMRLEELWNAWFCERYGSAETYHTKNANPPDQRRKFGTVGFSMGDTKEIIIDPDSGADGHFRIMPKGEAGEVFVTGTTVIDAYIDEPEANETAFVDIDGVRYYRTGDRGYIDEDGHLVLDGRYKELIISGGKNIDPKVSDGGVEKHSAVQEAITFGVPDPTGRLTEIAVCAIVLKPEYEDTTPEEILKWTLDGDNSGIDKHVVPRAAIILEADKLKKNPAGKKMRIAMSDIYGGALAKRYLEQEVSAGRWRKPDAPAPV